MRLLRPVLSLCLGLLLVSTAQAQAPQLPTPGPKPTAATQPVPLPPPNPKTTPQLTSEDVTAFLDGFLPLQLQRDDVAGATISIYQNGQPLLLKGYGYADFKKKTPVDPVVTTFRPGSISKLFTGIAGQAAVAIQNARLAKNIETETKTRAQFQRLLSPNLVEQLVAGKLHLEKGGELREVTILISDIRGFTSMSEKKEPAEIVHMLNEYFELMVDVLFRAQGTLDKYVGDEIMALFGAPVDMPDAPMHAVRCALEMMKALREFNRTRVAEGLDPIKIGIGINTGRVITGNQRPCRLIFAGSPA